MSVNFTFIMADNTKIAMNTRRKFEAQVCLISELFNIEVLLKGHIGRVWHLML